MKYIVVTGGVLSGLGKGIVASSIGKLLISSDYKVTAIKIDPYLNVDAGTMNPYQHGEVFVLKDGGEVDLDLGNYERFLDISLTKDNNITTGKIYYRVIEKERKGEYLGKTVQIVPHITDEIKYQITRVAKNANCDVCIIELGGTIGDIESMPYIEAIRQLAMEEKVCFVHTTLVPIVGPVGEQKTKPTQHSVRELRALGIQPNLIVGRCESNLTQSTKEKISLFCNVPINGIISIPDIETVYDVVNISADQNITEYIFENLQLKVRKPELRDWKNFVKSIKNPKYKVKIGIIGKYTTLRDSYLSHIEAFTHAGAKSNIRPELVFIESENVETEKDKLENYDLNGILVPGGFGARGIEGKLLAIKYSLKNKIPFLGVCLGFQLAVIEYCKSILNYKDANSTEFDINTKHPVIDILPSQKKHNKLGGTMRLGEKITILKKNTLVYKLYGTTRILERHRHRYEVNPKYIKKIQSNGLEFVGKSPDNKRMEILEYRKHLWFIAVQYHPEFKSRPNKPAPLYLGLIKAALKHKGVS